MRRLRYSTRAPVPGPVVAFGDAMPPPSPPAPPSVSLPCSGAGLFGYTVNLQAYKGAVCPKKMWAQVRMELQI